MQLDSICKEKILKSREASAKQKREPWAQKMCQASLVLHGGVVKACILQDQPQDMIHSTGFSAGRTGASVLSRVKSTVTVCNALDGLSF